LGELARSGKEIIGFDLNEVAPGEDEWDANVGARLLFKLCVFAGISKGLFQAAR
jgi:agmatinase